MEILFLTYNKTDACSFYRATGVAKDLRHKTGHNITVAEWKNMEMHWGTISDYDLIMIQRSHGKYGVDLCKHIKACKVPLWIDYDDNLLRIPQSNNKATDIFDADNRENIKQILRMADAVSVTTPELKKEFEPFSSNIWVIPNAHNDSILQPMQQSLKPREKVVAWRGTNTHIEDLSMVGAELDKLSVDFQNYRFLFVGYLPWFLNGANNMAYQKELDIIHYFNYMIKEAPTLLHVPLTDTKFNRCKSNIAFIEGSYIGAACIVPEWWNVPGIPYHDNASYYQAMVGALSGGYDLNAIAEEAWEFIQDTLTLSKVNVLRVQLINEIR
jgi:hypothetical protein